MGKRRLWTGIILGAAFGGLVTLFNQDTRVYVKNKAEKVYDNTTYYINHPDIGVKEVKKGIVSLNQAISDNTDGAMNTLTQVENSLQKFLKK